MKIMSNGVLREATAEEVEIINSLEVPKGYKIAELKQNLADTDYKALKYAEGLLTLDEYEPIREQRRAWRDEINRLESEDNADGVG